MNIHNISIDGFGHFAASEFGPFVRPVTVFYGPNEAGKSTLLEFIRTILFGFRPRSGRPPRGGWPNDYAPLVGGRHGGRIALTNGDGQQIIVERFKGGSVGRTTVTVGSSVTQGETVLAQLLGNHSRAVFERIFAFTLDELYSDDLLNDENVNSQIYSAGMGVMSLPNAIKTIESARSGIFLKGGIRQKIYEIYSKIDEIDNRLQEVAGNAASFGNLTARLEQIEAQIKDLTTRQQRLRSQHRHQVQLQRAWDPWNDLLSAKRELEILPNIYNFPTNGMSRLEALEERVRLARQECESASSRLVEAKSKARVQVEHEAILAHAVEIRGLERGRTSFDNSVRDLPKRKAALRGHERSLTETLKELGDGWNEVRLEAFDLSIAVREEISQYQELLRKTSGELEHRKAALAQAKTALTEAAEAEHDARQEIEAVTKPSLDSEQVRRRRDLIRTVAQRLHQLQSAKEQVYVIQRQLDGLATSIEPVGQQNRSRAVAAIGASVGIALLVGGVSLGGWALFIGAAAGLALVGIAIYMLSADPFSSKSGVESPLASPLRESLSDATTRLVEIQSTLEQDAATLDLEAINESSLIAAEGSLDNDENSIRIWTSLAQSLSHAGESRKRLESRSKQSLEAVNETSKQLETVEQGWQEWLRARGLRDTFLPESVVELRSKVNIGINQLCEVRSWRQRVNAIQKDIDEYIESVGPLAAIFEIPFEGNEPSTVAAAADKLVDLLKQVQDQVRDRNDAQAKLQDAERQCEERKCDLQEVSEEQTQLLRSGDAKDAEDFRMRANLDKRRAELDERVRTALDRLQRFSGPGEPLESLKSELSDIDSQSIADKIERLEEEQTTADAQNADLLTERGSIQSELTRLVGEHESSRLRMERNVLSEQIRGHARDWTRFTLAKTLLEEARSKFERERQPGVVRYAQKFFAEITKRRYQQLYVPLGKQTITITDADGRTKQPSELSRGTREQLFLSLRFGLIRELGQRTEPLPVVVDEVLVNFDPERALRAAIAFVELSQTNQVLVFTCHPTVVDLFRSAASEAGVEPPGEVTID